MHPPLRAPDIFIMPPPHFAGGMGGIAFIPFGLQNELGNLACPADTQEPVKAEYETQLSGLHTGSLACGNPPNWTGW